MLRFFQRLNHRDAVRGNLNALLLMYPRKRQFERDFPTLKATMREGFERSVPAASTALFIAARVIETLLSQLAESERQSVVEALLASDPRETEELAQRRIAGERDQPGDSVFFATRLCGVALLMAERMAQVGALRLEEIDHLAWTIAGNLRAENPDAFANFAKSLKHPGED
jgi:hypothetical protein